ncbi:MAG: TIGR03960 family B12-binding radical SAM protein, partial [Deltaproteobacteria bacterium]|nr:TIGR03960 family B12-binding radical SAM protein [Deltaproteobacteria bacterium]
TIKEVLPLLDGYTKATRRVELDINTLPRPVKPVVPFIEAIHDRLSVEISRGCVRGCRFCQAGMVTRPLRERDPEAIVEIIKEALANTGYDDLSLLSLSTGDYSCIEDLLSTLMTTLADKKVAISLPSLRVGTLNENFAKEISKVRKTGFTLAPEAGTSRLREVLNKGITEEALLKGVSDAFLYGWKSVKLYFMIGLPTETDHDIEQIPMLAKKVRDLGRKVSGKRPEVGVSAATFIPKPFTPFQWVPQMAPDIARKKLSFLRNEARSKKLGFKWHDAVMSEMEGVFSRGDRRQAKVIYSAFKKGARFDGWTEEFNSELWKSAFEEENITMTFYTERERPFDEVLPWDHLDLGITKEFLIEEYKLALKMESTDDCSKGRCTECGVCDHKVVKNILFRDKTLEKKRKKQPLISANPLRARLSFEKIGDMKFIGHLDTSRALFRAIIRAGLPLRYSQGFHPHPKIALLNPLPLGIESLDEYMDLELDILGSGQGGGISTDSIKDRLNATLPKGLKITSAKYIPLQLPSLSVMMKAQKYIVNLKDGSSGLNIEPARINGILRDFLNSEEVVLRIKRKGKEREMDIRQILEDIEFNPSELTLGFTLIKGEGAGIKPVEALSHLLGLSLQETSLIPITKTATVLNN